MEAIARLMGHVMMVCTVIIRTVIYQKIVDVVARRTIKKMSLDTAYNKVYHTHKYAH